jgi:hypothetical protein
MSADTHERFRALYEGLADPVYWFCRMRLGTDPGLAEDVVADVFTVVCAGSKQCPSLLMTVFLSSRSLIASSATNNGRCGVGRGCSVASTQRSTDRSPTRQQSKRRSNGSAERS